MKEIKSIKCGGVNCFLITQDNCSVLIDTGTSKYKNKILDLCKKSNVKLIILTHGHFDHIENTAFLKKELQASVAINKADLDIVSDFFSQSLNAHKLLGKIILFFSKKTAKKICIEKFTPDIFIDEAFLLKDYGIDGKIIELPGHTKGSVGVVLEDSVVVGDAMFNMISPTEAILYNDYETVKSSVKKIKELPCKEILCGHGKPIKNIM